MQLSVANKATEKSLELVRDLRGKVLAMFGFGSWARNNASIP